MRKSSPDAEPRLPIKIDSTTNAEYVPRPISSRLEHIRRVALEQCVENARRAGISRREFLMSGCAAATTLLALNQASCGGGHYAVPEAATVEPAAAETAVGGDEFVFDVQTHHVSVERRWWEAERPTIAEFLRTTPQARCGGEWAACFSRDVWFKEVFLDSDTSTAVLSALWGSDDMNAILVDEIAETRERLQRPGAPRVLIHGLVRPKSDSKAEARERMQAMAERLKIDAWKLYPVWSSDAKGYRLDDPETGGWALEQGVALGVPLFAIHKGLPLPGQKHAFTSAIDVGPAARAYPRATLLIYHSGYDGELREGPYDPAATRGVDTLIRGLKESGIGKGGNVYAELGSVWREVMKDPDQAAHVLGKLLVHLGEDRILWGTDAIWYGSPQDQIQAFRAFRISKEYRERFGYPELTAAIKAKILGLNAARVYRVDPAQVRRAHRGDGVARAREDYRNAPRPSFLTYGPRTPGELRKALKAEAGE